MRKDGVLVVLLRSIAERLRIIVIGLVMAGNPSTPSAACASVYVYFRVRLMLSGSLLAFHRYCEDTEARVRCCSAEYCSRCHRWWSIADSRQLCWAVGDVIERRQLLCGIPGQHDGVRAAVLQEQWLSCHCWRRRMALTSVQVPPTLMVATIASVWLSVSSSAIPATDCFHCRFKLRCMRRGR
jgi:hypothetical protein